MKQFNFKNCIAFTLAEMTLVLLITSIIAAASTPMITSAISGANTEKGSDLGATFDTPWKSATSYNAGGIYNSPRFIYSIVAIGHKTGSTPDGYGFPSLLVHQNNTSSFISTPQIQIIPTYGLLYANYADTYTNIAMDEYQNLAITNGPSFEARKNAIVTASSSGNTYLGSHINRVYVGHHFHDVFIGYGIDTASVHRSVAVGSNIYSGLYNHWYDTIVMGNNHNFKTGSDGSDIIMNGSVIMGNYAGYASYGSHNIFMGTYAGYGAETSRNIMIGNHAGMNFAASSGNKLLSYDNILIGDNAGYTVEYPSPGPGASTYAFNTYIGKYAGAFIGSPSGGAKSGTTPATARSFLRNVMIGSYAGIYRFGNKPVLSQADNLYIGDYAGYTHADSAGTNVKATYKSRRTCIGSNACHNENALMLGDSYSYNDINDHSILGEDSTFIGTNAGRESGDGGFNIMIGSNAGRNTYSSMLTKYAIYMGTGAGYESSSLYSIYIGTYAGYGSKNTEYFSNYYEYSDRLANVGIGYATCQNISFGGKWCLGSGTINQTLYYTYQPNRSDPIYPKRRVWSTDDFGPQMVIGFVDAGKNNQNIVFYASKVIKGGLNPSSEPDELLVPDEWNTSDRRLKKDIVPSKHSINDIRKINIYDFNYKNDEDKKTVTGIIAQEYRKIFPLDVSVEPTTKKLAASSDWLLYSLANAIKELDKEIIAVQNDIKVYIKDFMGLKSKVAKLEKQAEKIKAENKQMRNQLAKINKKLK